MLIRTHYDVPRIGRLTTIDVDGGENERIELPKLEGSRRLLVTIEGDGAVSVLATGIPPDGEWSWGNTQRAPGGMLRNGDPDSGYVHALVSTTMPESGGYFLSIVNGDGIRRLRVRVLELFEDAKIRLLELIRSFAKCTVCREIVKMLIHAILLFLGVPPAGLDLVDFDKVGDVIKDQLHDWIRTQEHLYQFLHDFLDDKLDLLFDLLKRCIQMISPGNLVAKELCKQLGYCA